MKHAQTGVSIAALVLLLLVGCGAEEEPEPDTSADVSVGDTTPGDDASDDVEMEDDVEEPDVALHDGDATLRDVGPTACEEDRYPETRECDCHGREFIVMHKGCEFVCTCPQGRQTFWACMTTDGVSCEHGEPPSDTSE